MKVQLAVIGFHQSATPSVLSVRLSMPWALGGEMM
jgi:hypothetical protein